VPGHAAVKPAKCFDVYHFSCTSRVFINRWRQACPSSRMKERVLTIPEIVLIAGTRVALGVGIGLLLADRLNRDQRKGAGWALFGVGAISSVPIVIGVLSKRPLVEKSNSAGRSS
jgi:hypothetical protein